MKKKIFYAGISFLATTLTVEAANLSASAVTNTKARASTTATATISYAFNIEPNSPLTVKLLDKAWAERENENNQKIIANYLVTKPAVPEDYETAWKTARLVYFIGNYGIGEKEFVNSSAGVKLFDYGAEAAKTAINLNPKGVEGHYWYAIDLGSYGLAKGILAAASGAKDGMNALRSAIEIDPSYQWYGSSRILGRYYQELPGLFGGDNKKAFDLIKNATDKAPQYKNNWVFLGQYYIKTKQYQEAIDACQKALSIASQDGKYEEMRYTREANECISKAKSKLADK